MTLILVAANSDFVVQLSDRRLTRLGKTVNDEANKAVLIHARDGRLVAGYTGLGDFRSFKADEFVAEVAMTAAEPDFTVLGIANRFPAVATAKMKAHRDASVIPATDRNLTISLFGFGPDKRHGPATPGGLLVTNQFGDHPGPAKDHFTPVRVRRVRTDVRLQEVTLIEAIGASSMVNDDAVADLRQLLVEHRPPEAVVGMGVDLMRSWAHQKLAHGTVGDQISSIVVPAHINQGWVFDYHTSEPTDTIHHPMFVDATGRMSSFAARFDIRQEEGAIAVPRVGRNHPCPCGSGFKFKRCHDLRAGGSKGNLI